MIVKTKNHSKTIVHLRPSVIAVLKLIKLILQTMLHKIQLIRRIILRQETKLILEARKLAQIVLKQILQCQLKRLMIQI